MICCFQHTHTHTHNAQISYYFDDENTSKLRSCSNVVVGEILVEITMNETIMTWNGTRDRVALAVVSLPVVALKICLLVANVKIESISYNLHVQQ